MIEAKRVHLITSIFPFLWGLRLLPLGLFVLAAGANDARLIPPLSHFLGLPVVVLLTWMIHRYYRRSFGVVEPEACGTAALGTLFRAIGLALIAVLAFDLIARLRVSMTGIVMAGFEFALLFLVLRRPYRLAYAIAGAVLLCGFLLLSFRIPSGIDDRVFEPGGLLQNLFVGTVLILGGIADHVVLTRSLAPAPRDLRV